MFLVWFNNFDQPMNFCWNHTFLPQPAAPLLCTLDIIWQRWSQQVQSQTLSTTLWL